MSLLEQHGAAAGRIELSSKVEVAPITIPPNMPLPFIYRMVNAEGFNYVPVIKHVGPLAGMVRQAGSGVCGQEQGRVWLHIVGEGNVWDLDYNLFCNNLHHALLYHHLGHVYICTII